MDTAPITQYLIGVLFMARSIHITKRHLKQERFFAASDNVPWGPDATELEKLHIKKLLLKDNAGWRKAAGKAKTPTVAQLKLKHGKIIRTLFTHKT
ncbi:MAG: hypothetical protein ACFUZC_05070 [Chthoniobacteraceae bacterium]